jgi:ubiquinone/menaquinone biosynthesis C-methylase UbiE
MTRKDNITQFTDKYQKSGAIGLSLLRNFFKTIKSLMPDNLTSVAEIGCGAGHSTEVLRGFLSQNISFTASDVEPELVELAKGRNANVNFLTESIYSLEHPDNSFDLVFCLEVLEHLEKPRDALKELARITKKYVIISVPREPLWRVLNMLRGAYWGTLGNTPGHINHWSKHSLEKFISQEFDIIKTSSSIPWTIVLAKKRI